MPEGLPTTFGIHGSCVSVDIFEFNKTINSRLLNKPAMRDTTIFSSNIRASSCIDIIKHSSSLHTMWLNTIYNGMTFQFLKENAGEFLIIDLVDERHDLFSYQGAVFNRNFFEESNFFSQINRNDCLFISQGDISDVMLKERVHIFCGKLMEIYEPQKIIINRFYLIDKYIDGENIREFTNEEQLKYIEKSKKFFHKWYSWLIEELPGCIVMDFIKTYYADKNNPRGLAAYHNTMDYYTDSYSQLQKIVSRTYQRQREIPLSRFKYKKTSDNEYIRYKAFGIETYNSKQLARIEKYTALKGKKVLWISRFGIPHNAVRAIGIEKFAQLLAMHGEGDGSEEYIAKHKDAISLSSKLPRLNDLFLRSNFLYFYGDLENIQESFCDYFDIIFLEEIEYIKHFALTLDNMYKCLKMKGMFFAKAGRTWSSSNGGKWKISDEINYLSNPYKAVEFSHLFCNYNAIIEELTEMTDFSQSSIHDMAYDICRGEEKLNHLMYEDYEDYVSNSLFAKKEISPLFKDEVNDKIFGELKQKYPNYNTFDYKSLWIACQK